MNSGIFAELKGTGHVQPVFQGMRLQVELQESLAITTMTHTYCNEASGNPDALYTFSLPSDALLLELTVTMGERVLKGRVLPEQEGEPLENPRPGVTTISLGTLLPGERARITLRYGQFLRWQGDTLRYQLARTTLPRCGGTQRSEVNSPQEPESSLPAGILIPFEMKISGELARMEIHSPSHEIAVTRNPQGEESVLNLPGNFIDTERDLIITITDHERQGASAIAARDGDNYLLWGSFHPRFDLEEAPPSRSVKIVVDCCSGDSIPLLREALLRVLDELRPREWFNIIAIGGSARQLFNAQTRANPEALASARSFLMKLEPNRWRAQLGNALEMAFRLRCLQKIQQDILLITDGETVEWEKIVARCVKANHRFFTVGVGSSVSEKFIRTLARRTGGGAELVSPNGEMVERIHRHFKLIGTPRARGVQVAWPGEPVGLFPVKIPTLFDGESYNLFAWFSEPPVGELQLRMDLPDGSLRLLTAQIQPSRSSQDQIIPAMVAALRAAEITPPKVAQELPLQSPPPVRIISPSAAKVDVAPASPREAWLWEEDRRNSLDRFVEQLNGTLEGGAMPTTIRLPLLPTGIANVLGRLVEEGIEELIVSTLFLQYLAGSASGDKLSRQAKRVIGKGYKQLLIDREVARSIRGRLRVEPGQAPPAEEESVLPASD